MERVGFVLKVRQARLDEYKLRHEHVWPEMLDALRQTGWRNYSLFLREDGLLFGYLETGGLRRSAGRHGRDRRESALAGGDGAVAFALTRARPRGL